MEIPKHYNPKQTEDKWYKYWLDNEFFKSVPDDREPYTIVIPPPNVTGVLHMGHMLNNTIQDVLIRRARMLGKNACWVPGTDHASIATEAKVVTMLKKKGIEKSDISREEFLKHAWEWTGKYGGLILEQLKKLGASCDWDRTRFTMEEDLSNAVIDVFIKLHNKGLIYRGVRMVNWDPDSKTAVSDEEVIHKEVNSKLYYIRYEIEGTDKTTPSPAPSLENSHHKMRGQERGISLPLGEGQGGAWITIATTRPETILGDTAVCMHPDDERYKNLKGKRVIIPLIGRSVPVIFDEYIDMEFGTGVLKVTPAHDINDYELGVKHKLEAIDIFNDDGTLSEKAQLYVGEDRFAARGKISEQLSHEGYLVKVEEIKNKVGYSERTDAVIEPKLSMQWFLKMSELSKPALENVMNDSIKLIPAKFKNTYRHWMENVRDWCISRQLWWGHRIPAWYDEDGNYVIAKTEEEAIKLFKIQNPKSEIRNIKQDEDVLDTWFSSWIWPISVFDGFSQKGEKDIQYYYPTNDLVTAPDILFFWVARMIMAGYEFRGEKPFKNVYLTGMVRDKLHRKMSKSLGNSPEPLDLIDKYGADGVRAGMLLCSPAGNDLLFDESLCEQGRNFSNKIWNAFRLVKSWEVDENAKQPKSSEVAVDWFDAKLNKTIAVIDDHFSKYRISDALMAIYKLIWDDFCSWYLEMIKPSYEKPIDKKTFNATVSFFESILKLLHPFMPFISEEIWHLLSEREERDCIIVADWPKAGGFDEKVLVDFEKAIEKIVGIRTFRKEQNISSKDTLKFFIKEDKRLAFDSVIIKLGNLDELNYTHEKIDNAYTFITGSTENFILMEESMVDVKAESEKLQRELDYTKDFMKSVEKKLNNQRFVQKAPTQVIELERKKQADSEAKIKILEEQLRKFKK